MKNKLKVFSLLFSNFIVFGQEAKELNDNYFFDLTNVENGKGIIEIKEFVNTKLDSIRDRNKEETKSFSPSKGTYILRNENQKFKFEIDEDGNFVGDAMAEVFLRQKYHNFHFYFEKGKAKEIIVRDENNRVLKSLKNDDTFFKEFHFDKQGRVIFKKMFDHKEGRDNAVITEYYPNGRVRTIENKKDKTKTLFYENGKLEFFFNAKTLETLEKDERGNKIYHAYPSSSEDYFCKEFFKKGLITKRKITLNDNSKICTYYYKNGKVDYYEVQDKRKKETFKFNSHNRLIMS